MAKRVHVMMSLTTGKWVARRREGCGSCSKELKVLNPDGC